MPKNIVICCDGTDNRLTIDKNSNVVHLYSCLVQNEEQISYYNPGVGTIGPRNLKFGLMHWIYKIWDFVSAFSLEGHVKQAYIYLMNNYEEGDSIYLIGFSRGAYTVRMLHGVITMYGLLQKGNEAHLPYIFEVYATKKRNFELANKFKKRFSREVEFKFIGVWDTVVSVGNPFSFYRYFPFSETLKNAETMRHCLAIDEKRKHYEPSHHKELKGKDHKAVWFAGVHSDVGGSYEENEAGLSKIALEYMLSEASHAGLRLSKSAVQKYLGYTDKDYTQPNALSKAHNSLTPLFILIGILPRILFDDDSKFFKTKVIWSIWKKRKIKPNPSIHQSVIDRMSSPTMKYKPKNIDWNAPFKVIDTKEILYFAD